MLKLCELSSLADVGMKSSVKTGIKNIGNQKWGEDHILQLRGLVS